MTRKTIPNDYGKQGENHSILVHDDCNHNRLLITVYTVRKISASSLNLPVLYLLSEYTVRDGNLKFFFLLGQTVYKKISIAYKKISIADFADT